MFAGITVLIAVGIFVEPQLIPTGWNAKDVIGSSTITVAFLLLVYVTGAVIEIFADFFLRRGIGSIIWVIGFPFRDIELEQKILKWIMRFIALITVPISAIIMGIVGLIGFCPYRQNPCEIVSDDAKKHFAGDKIPAIVKTGISEPYGDHFDVAWKYLASKLCEENRRLIYSKFAACNDLMTMITAIFSIFLIYLFSDTNKTFFGQTTVNIGKSDTGLQNGNDASGGLIQNADPQFVQINIDIFLYLSVTSVILIILSYSYFFVLRSAIRNCLELYGMEQDYPSIVVEENVETEMSDA